MLKFYTATTAETSSETKFMTVSKKVGKHLRQSKRFLFNYNGSYLGANTMGPLLESSPMPSRPKIDDVFSPLQPV